MLFLLTVLRIQKCFRGWRARVHYRLLHHSTQRRRELMKQAEEVEAAQMETWTLYATAMQVCTPSILHGSPHRGQQRCTWGAATAGKTPEQDPHGGLSVMAAVGGDVVSCWEAALMTAAREVPLMLWQLVV